eukprot:6459490-Amphidinium_carterae.1
MAPQMGQKVVEGRQGVGEDMLGFPVVPKLISKLTQRSIQQRNGLRQRSVSDPTPQEKTCQSLLVACKYGWLYYQRRQGT